MHYLIIVDFYAGLDRLREGIEKLGKRDIEVQYKNKIQFIGTVELPYLGERGRGESQRLIAQAKCGNT